MCLHKYIMVWCKESVFTHVLTMLDYQIINILKCWTKIQIQHWYWYVVLKIELYIHLYFIATQYLWKYALVEDIYNWTRSYILIIIYWNRQKS